LTPKMLESYLPIAPGLGIFVNFLSYAEHGPARFCSYTL
jgi:hypothetical protein